jgi:integrase/recombinase XerD
MTLYILRSFYNYACKKDLCKKNLAVLLEPVKVKQKERDYLTEEEFEELVQCHQAACG